MVDAAPEFSCQGRFIRDAQGRVRLFRGVNVSGRAKLPPFVGLSDPAALDPLQAWGFNAIRLLVTWEGLEPDRGCVDEAYLERVVGLAEAAGERGIAVIVDCHQDLFARAFGGDGAPPWVTGDVALPAAGRAWFFRYVHPVVRRFQDAFWDDREGWQTAFLATFAAVVRRFKHVPNVLGYDPWNEPMGGLRSLATGRLERELLPAFYERCAAIRDAEDHDRILFVEPTAMAGLGQPIRLPPLSIRQLAYAPHAYDSGSLAVGRYVPRLSSFPRILESHVRQAERMDCPLLLGEFGVLNGLRGGARMLADECSRLDRAFASWTAWHYNPSDVDWNDEGASIVDSRGDLVPWAAALIRPQPRAIAGDPEAFESRVDRPWTLRYRARAGETEIVVPAAWGGETPDFDIECGQGRWDGSVLRVRADGDATVAVRLHRGRT